MRTDLKRNRVPRRTLARVDYSPRQPQYKPLVFYCPDPGIVMIGHKCVIMVAYWATRHAAWQTNASIERISTADQVSEIASALQ